MHLSTVVETQTWSHDEVFLNPRHGGIRSPLAKGAHPRASPEAEHQLNSSTGDLPYPGAEPALRRSSTVSEWSVQEGLSYLSSIKARGYRRDSAGSTYVLNPQILINSRRGQVSSYFCHQNGGLYVQKDWKTSGGKPVWTISNFLQRGVWSNPVCLC